MRRPNLNTSYVDIKRFLDSFSKFEIDLNTSYVDIKRIIPTKICW